MAKLPNDDLFEGTKMSFGEHLEELRRSLFKAIVGIVVGFLIGLALANYVVDFIQSPLKRALTKYYVNKATEKLSKEFGGSVPFELLTLIKLHNVVPEDLTADPGRLVHALRAADPEFKVEFKPYRFTADDVVDGDFPGLCAAIERGAKDADSPGEAVWQFLSPEQRELVERVAGKSSVGAADRSAVIAALNDVIDQPKLHETAAFKQQISDAIRALDSLNFAGTIDKDWATTVKSVSESLDAGDDDQSRRLNKLLVTGAFPKVLGPSQLMTVNLRFWKPAEVSVQALGAHEMFMIWVKAGAVTGLVIASPWVFWQIWQFVAAGLYPHEKRYVFLYLPFSLILFLAGAALAFFFVFDPVLEFLFSFNQRMNVDPDPRISEWLSFVLMMPLGFGIAFQLPLVMLFLNRIGIVSVAAYLDKWRIAILAIFVISMLLTPADPVSMLLMAVPLTALYFGGIALCKWMPRGRNPFAEAYEP